MARRLVLQGTKTVPDALAYLILGRKPVLRDIAWLRAAIAAEGSERARVAAGWCGYRQRDAERNRGTE
jgi:hypothetical protein